MDKVIIEKDGHRYSVERFDDDGKKTVVEHGMGVEHPYKARQFVVTTLGERPGHRHIVKVLDSMASFGEFKVIEGSFDVTQEPASPVPEGESE